MPSQRLPKQRAGRPLSARVINAPLPILDAMRNGWRGGGGMATVSTAMGLYSRPGARQIWAARTDSGGVTARTDGTTTVTNPGDSSPGNPDYTGPSSFTTIGQLGSGNAYEAAPYVDGAGNIKLRVSPDTMTVYNLGDDPIPGNSWVFLTYVLSVPVIIPIGGGSGLSSAYYVAQTPSSGTWAASGTWPSITPGSFTADIYESVAGALNLVTTGATVYNHFPSSPGTSKRILVEPCGDGTWGVTSESCT